MRGITVILLLLPNGMLGTQPCDDWLQAAKIKPGPGCLERCVSIPVGMETFFCHRECKKFCALTPSPILKWRSKIKDGRPKDWYPKIEKSKKWTVSEIEKALATLKELPEKLTSSVKGFYRMDSSIFGDNPGREDNGNVILYDSAFGEKYTLSRVVAHESSHNWFESMSQKDRDSYLSSAQWKRYAKDENYRSDRPRQAFVSPRGMESPGEDFALNAEHYLYDPEKLKKISPRVYEWFERNYGSWLHL